MATLVSVSVPPSFNETPLKARDTLSMAKGTLELGGLSPEGQKILSLVDETLTVNDYFRSSEDAPPLKSNRFKKLRDSFDELRVSGYSLKKLGTFLMSTVMTTKTYITHCETVTGGKIPFYIPLSGIIFPAYKLYSSKEGLSKDYQKWANAEGSEETYNAFFKLLGSGTCFACNVVKLVGAVIFAEFAESINFGLAAIIYLASCADILKAEYDSYPSSEQKYNTPPQFIKI